MDLKQQINLHGYQYLVASHCELNDRTAQLISDHLQLCQDLAAETNQRRRLINAAMTCIEQLYRRIDQLEQTASTPAPRPTAPSAAATVAPAVPSPGLPPVIPDPELARHRRVEAEEAARAWCDLWQGIYQIAVDHGFPRDAFCDLLGPWLEIQLNTLANYQAAVNERAHWCASVAHAYGGNGKPADGKSVSK